MGEWAEILTGVGQGPIPGFVPLFTAVAMGAPENGGIREVVSLACILVRTLGWPCSSLYECYVKAAAVGRQLDEGGPWREMV